MRCSDVKVTAAQLENCGGSDQGGERTWGSEHNGMTAAPRRNPREKSLYGKVVGKPIHLKLGEGRCFHGKKRAGAPWEPTGVRVQTPGERSAEITPGRSDIQQGLVTTCKDPSTRRELKEEGGYGTDA
jgi:hypothetical protein